MGRKRRRNVESLTSGWQSSDDEQMDVAMRNYVLAGTAVLAAVVAALSVSGQEAFRQVGYGTRSVPATEMMIPARPAVEKGLKFLQQRQLEDGAFATRGYGRNAAVVAL